MGTFCLFLGETMSAFTSALHTRMHIIALGACAALSGCGLFSTQPAYTGAPAANSVNNAPIASAPVSSAPIVDASVNSQGQPIAPIVTAAAQPGATAPALSTPAHNAAVYPQAAQQSAPSVAVPVSGLHLQAGTFSHQNSAESIAASVRSKAPQYAQLVHVTPRGSNWRVLIGPFPTDAERSQAAATIRTAIGSEVVNAAP